MRTDAGKIAFSPGHYDASSYTRERDWGWPQAGASEDATFTYGDRLLALARLRREVRNNPFLAGLAQKFAEAVGTSNLRSAAKDRRFNSDKESFW